MICFLTVVSCQAGGEGVEGQPGHALEAPPPVPDQVNNLFMFCRFVLFRHIQ